jgi:hypothetical protein
LGVKNIITPFEIASQTDKKRLAGNFSQRGKETPC